MYDFSKAAVKTLITVEEARNELGDSGRSFSKCHRFDRRHILVMTITFD